MSCCYTYRVQRNIPSPLFSPDVVPVAVVLTMTDAAERHRKVEEELLRYPVCETVVFQYNRGFKRWSSVVSHAAFY